MQLKAAFLLVFVGCLFCVVQGQEVNIKVVHAVAGAPNVDVYANGTLLVANAPYGAFTSYVPVRPGRVQLEVTATGNRPSANTTLISLNATLIAEQYYTIAAVGAIANVTAFPLELVVFNDTIDTVTNRALVRTIHLSAGSNPINVQESGQFIWRNIAYPNTGVPEYEVFNANIPNIIQIVDARTFRVQAGPTLLNFAPNSVNSIYYIGVENSLTTPLTIAFQQDYILGQVSPTRTPSSSQTPTTSFTSTISRTGSNSRTPSRTTSFSRTSTNTRTPSTTRSTNATDSASPTLSSTTSGSFTTTPSFTVSTSVTDFTTRSAFRTDNNIESRTVSLANSASRTRFTVQTQTQTRSPFRSAPDYSDDDDIIFASQSRTPVPTLQSSSRSRTRTGFSVTATGTPTPTRNILSIFSASRTVGLVLPSVSPPIFGTFISRTPFTSLSVLPSVSAGCMPVISIMSTVMLVLFALVF